MGGVIRVGGAYMLDCKFSGSKGEGSSSWYSDERLVCWR